jgi:hypothetical protein
MEPKYKKFNNGMVTLLCIISLATRRAYAYGVKSKKTKDLFPAFETFVSDVQKIPEFDKPKKIVCDAGNEFSKPVIEYLSKNNIDVFVVNKSESNSHATSVVERFNRTLRELIGAWLTSSNSNTFVDVLSDLTENYNTSEHRTMDKPPAQVTEADVLDRNKDESSHNKDINEKYHDFNNDDAVRVIKKKAIFSKGRTNKVSDKVYFVSRVLGNKIMLKNDVGVELKNPRFLFELVKVPNVQYDTNNTHAKELKNEQKKIVHRRRIKKEGLDVPNDKIDEIMTKV